MILLCPAASLKLSSKRKVGIPVIRWGLREELVVESERHPTCSCERLSTAEENSQAEVSDRSGVANVLASLFQRVPYNALSASQLRLRATPVAVRENVPAQPLLFRVRE
jgi:hypothetical protein